MISNFLFPRNYSEPRYSAFLFLMRVVFGALLMNHGIQKLMEFEAMSATFPDPLGVGGTVSLGLAVFAELFCSAAFIVGALYRLSLLPIIVSMAVAFFGVHGGSIAEGELAFAYLAIFVMMYLAGPGKYSLDSVLRRYLRPKASNTK